MLPESREVLTCVHHFSPVRLPIIRHKDDDYVHILVLFLQQWFQVSNLVVRSENEDDPFHRTLNPLTVHLRDFILWFALHSVDRVMKRIQGVFLHLFVSKLVVANAGPVLLQIFLVNLLQVFGKVLEVQLLHLCVHLLLLEDDNIL